MQTFRGLRLLGFGAYSCIVENGKETYGRVKAFGLENGKEKDTCYIVSG